MPTLLADKVPSHPSNPSNLRKTKKRQRAMPPGVDY